MADRKIKFNLFLKVLVVLTIVIFVIIVIKTAGVSIENDTLKIKGLYGISIPISEIESITKLEELPFNSWRRTNGIGLGPIKLGHFEHKDLGKIRLYIVKPQKPYIMIVTKDEKLIIGFGTEKNEDIYKRLKN